MSQLLPRKYLTRFLQRLREAAPFTPILAAARTRKEFSDACVYTAPVCFRYSVCVDLRSVFLSRLSVDTVSHFRTLLARLPGQASPPRTASLPPSVGHGICFGTIPISLRSVCSSAERNCENGRETLPFECVSLLCVLCRGTAN